MVSIVLYVDRERVLSLECRHNSFSLVIMA